MSKGRCEVRKTSIKLRERRPSTTDNKSNESHLDGDGGQCSKTTKLSKIGIEEEDDSPCENYNDDDVSVYEDESEDELSDDDDDVTDDDDDGEDEDELLNSSDYDNQEVEEEVGNEEEEEEDEEIVITRRKSKKRIIISDNSDNEQSGEDEKETKNDQSFVVCSSSSSSSSSPCSPIASSSNSNDSDDIDDDDKFFLNKKYQKRRNTISDEDDVDNNDDNDDDDNKDVEPNESTSNLDDILCDDDKDSQEDVGSKQRQSCLAYLPVSTLESQYLYVGEDGYKIYTMIHKFNELLRQIHIAQCKSIESIETLKRLQRLIRNDPSKDTDVFRKRLAKQFSRTANDSEVEMTLNRECISMLHKIREKIGTKQREVMSQMSTNQFNVRKELLMKVLNDRANSLPLFIGKTLMEKAPPLCGSIAAESNYTAKVGDLVAAMIRSDDDEKKEVDRTWILAEVISYQSAVYVVEDVDDEDKEQHFILRRHLIPLPKMKVNPVTHPDAVFKVNQKVLALYPQTTCFYRGIILQSPKTHHENYLVQFEDTAYPEGLAPPVEIQQRYVINHRDLYFSNGGRGRLHFSRVN